MDGDAVVGALWSFGFALCVADITLIARRMRKQLREFLHADLRGSEFGLVACAGFAVFPFMNLLVGGLTLAHLLVRPPVWGKRTGGKE